MLWVENKKNNHKIQKDYSSEFYSLLSFEPTNAQKRCVNDCVVDMMSDKNMNRLIQGDVGSGKTAVAGAVMYTMIQNGYQTAMMAPTEILAVQHYEGFKRLFEGTSIRVALLTGSTSSTNPMPDRRIPASYCAAVVSSS